MERQRRMANRTRAGVLALAAAALMVPQLALGAPTSQISVRDDSFSPRQPAPLPLGGTFSWKRAPGSIGDHNVNQVAGLFRSGPPTATAFDSSHPYSLKPSAGSFRYFCDAHRALNMVGTIKVRPIVVAGTLTSNGFRVRWASPTQKPTGGRFDVRYQVNGGPWKIWRNDTKSADGAFGSGSKPVPVMPGRTYRIQALSEKLSNVSKRSDWSPALVVKPPA
jgi:plastocyanin